MIETIFHRHQDAAERFEEGYYLIPKRRAGRVDVPLHIWFGPPPDPDERGAVLDRSPRWNIEINGVLFGDPDQPVYISGRPVETLDGIWPEARRHPTDEADYRFRVARAEYAELYDPNDPFGGTGGRIDPLTATLPMFEENR